MVKEIWASYKGDDGSQCTVDKVKVILEERGVILRPFRHENGYFLSHGESIGKLTEVIGRSRAVVFFFTQDFPNSKDCRNELQLVLRDKINNTFACVIGLEIQDNWPDFIQQLASLIEDDGDFFENKNSHYNSTMDESEIKKVLEERFERKISCLSEDPNDIAASILEYLDALNEGQEEEFDLIEKFYDWIYLPEQGLLVEMFNNINALSRAAGEGESNIEVFAKSVLGAPRELRPVKTIIKALEMYANEPSEKASNQIEVIAGFLR